jgi:hypothetical protein
MPPTEISISVSKGGCILLLLLLLLLLSLCFLAFDGVPTPSKPAVVAVGVLLLLPLSSNPINRSTS